MEILLGDLQLDSTRLGHVLLLKYRLTVVGVSLLPFHIDAIHIYIGHQVAFSALHLDGRKLLLEP